MIVIEKRTMEFVEELFEEFGEDEKVRILLHKINRHLEALGLELLQRGVIEPHMLQPLGNQLCAKILCELLNRNEYERRGEGLKMLNEALRKNDNKTEK